MPCLYFQFEDPSDAGVDMVEGFSKALCPICLKVVPGPAYNLHMKRHKEVKQHKCEFCGMVFSRRWTLNRHRMTHSNERPYSCRVCGKQFIQLGNMRVHERKNHNLEWVHSVRKYEGNETLGKTFITGVSCPLYNPNILHCKHCFQCASQLDLSKLSKYSSRHLWLYMYIVTGIGHL